MAGSGSVPVAFWLLPIQADADWLGDRIRQLARRHDAPDFDPHITLHVGRCTRRADIETVLRQLAGRWTALRLAASHTGHSATFYKAVYVDIAGDRLDGARLGDMRRHLVHELLAAELRVNEGSIGAASAPQPADIDAALAPYEFLPHVSLLYGDLPQPLRLELASQNDLQGRSIAFDRVAAVRPAAGYCDLSTVAGWEVFGHTSLGAERQPSADRRRD